jgi:hypothetical protein
VEEDEDTLVSPLLASDPDCRPAVTPAATAATTTAPIRGGGGILMQPSSFSNSLSLSTTNIDQGDSGEAADSMSSSNGRRNHSNSSCARRWFELTDPRFITNPILRYSVLKFLSMPTVAECCYSDLFFLVVTHGRYTAFITLLLYVVTVVLAWIPMYLCTYVVSEFGVYLVSVLFIVYCGRAVLRLLAFPGISRKMVRDIEEQFTKYSVKLLTSAAETIAACPHQVLQQYAANASSSPPQVPVSVWLRTTQYRDRVVAVYAAVLTELYHESPIGITSGLSAATTPNSPAFDRYGNNQLHNCGNDIGNLTGVSVSVEIHTSKESNQFFA